MIGISLKASLHCFQAKYFKKKLKHCQRLVKMIGISYSDKSRLFLNKFFVSDFSLMKSFQGFCLRSIHDMIMIALHITQRHTRNAQKTLSREILHYVRNLTLFHRIKRNLRVRIRLVYAFRIRKLQVEFLVLKICWFKDLPNGLS